jgi:hypothetical protein
MYRAGPAVRSAHAPRRVDVAVSISPRAFARESDAGSPRITWLRHARARMTTRVDMSPSFSHEDDGFLVFLTSIFPRARMADSLCPSSVILARGRRRRAGGFCRARCIAPVRRCGTNMPGSMTQHDLSPPRVPRGSLMLDPRASTWAAAHARARMTTCVDMSPSFSREDDGPWGMGSPVFSALE